MASKAKALLQLPAVYTVHCPPDMLYSHALRLSPHWELAKQRREIAGRELDPWIIRENYCMQRLVPAYQLRQQSRRLTLIALVGLAGSLTLWAQIERILDWVEYEVYVK